MPIKADWIPFNPKNIRSLSPSLVGVYECGCKRGDKVLYIGKGNIRERLLDHIEKKKFDAVTHFRKRRTEDPKGAEERLMDAFCKAHNGDTPLLNVQRPTARNSSQAYVPLDRVRTLL
jgi:hypothetical protein